MARAIPREGEERAATNVARPSGKLWIPIAKPGNEWLSKIKVFHNSCMFNSVMGSCSQVFVSNLIDLGLIIKVAHKHFMANQLY